MSQLPADQMSSNGDIRNLSAYADSARMTSFADMLARTPTDLGLIIRDRRRALGLDQAALARRVGVSRQWIVEMERGKPRAEVGLVLRTLSALGIRLEVSASDVDDDAIDAVVERARGDGA